MFLEFCFLSYLIKIAKRYHNKLSAGLATALVGLLAGQLVGNILTQTTLWWIYFGLLGCMLKELHYVKKRLGLVTPAKNEVQNISELVDGVLSNSENILAWVFVNDQSDDGTLELIESKYSEIIKHIDYFTIINMVGTDELYGLGKKYSSVVSFGFDRLKILESKHSFRCDYVGILDADSIPSADYYSNILDHFKCSSKIGIYSGINVIRNENGRERILLQEFIMGGG